MSLLSHLASGTLLEGLLAEAVRDHNVLPLTGYCNMNCSFCSHRQNPARTRAYSFAPLPEALLESLLPCFDRQRKIIIGESATRLREGEPLTHPHFLKTAQSLRRLYPETLLQVTTNGLLLDIKTVKELARLKPLEIIYSVNSISGKGRAVLMEDPHPEKAVAILELLHNHKLPFHGSMVALPHLTGWEDLQETISSLDSAGAITIRIMKPGYTKLADPLIVPPRETEGKLNDFIHSMQGSTVALLLLEPPFIDNLEAVIEGVMGGSPAERAGLRAGDRITAVAGRKVFSRVDAFLQLKGEGDTKIKVMRGSVSIEAAVEKEKGESGGIAVAYDLDPAQVDRLEFCLENDGNSLVLVSKPALSRWQAVARTRKMKFITLQSVPSLYFGGSIEAAGLLTVADFQAALEQAEDLNSFAKIILPSIAFDRAGIDLSGRSYLDLHTGGIPVELVS